MLMDGNDMNPRLEDFDMLSKDIAHPGRLALSGRMQDVQMFLRRAANRYRKSIPELAESLSALLREAPTRSSPLRKGAVAAIPVDADSRLQLARHEIIKELPAEPIFSEQVAAKLDQIVAEHRQIDVLRRG